MKSPFLFVTTMLALSLTACERNIGPSSVAASEPDGNPKLMFQLPAPHKWNMTSPLKCKAVATVVLHQKTDDPYHLNTLIAEAKPGTDKWSLQLVNDTLLLRVGEAGTDRYKVTKNTVSYLSAVFMGEPVPVVRSIEMNKDKGFAGWTMGEPADVFTDVPYAESIFLACR